MRKIEERKKHDKLERSGTLAVQLFFIQLSEAISRPKGVIEK
jgi:hypothetical protein